METDNIGEVGIESIRIGGMKLKHLPIAESAYAKAQMPEAIATDTRNKIEGILKKYPTQRVAYLKSRIKECKENVKRIDTIRSQQNNMISEYTAHITMCKFRDDEIARLSEDDPDRESKIRDLNIRFPPYNVGEMQKQINQCVESIDRATEVVAREYASVAELSEVLGLCQKRDEELKAYGVRVA